LAGRRRIRRPGQGSILADAFEAILGSIYLDAGWEASGSSCCASSARPSSAPVRSRTTSTTRADCRRRPYVRARGRRVTWWWVRARPRPGLCGRGLLGGTRRGAGEGRSKKDAEQEAARAAWRASPVPELPEVETLRQDLSREVVGKKIKAVPCPTAAPCAATPRRSTSGPVGGHTIKSWVVWQIPAPDARHRGHAGRASRMSGQLLAVSRPRTPSRSTPT